jgi:hypothetical protein
VARPLHFQGPDAKNHKPWKQSRRRSRRAFHGRVVLPSLDAGARYTAPIVSCWTAGAFRSAPNVSRGFACQLFPFAATDRIIAPTPSHAVPIFPMVCPTAVPVKGAAAPLYPCISRNVSLACAVRIMPTAPAGQEKRGQLVAPQLLQRWGSDHPNLQPPILHLDRASGPLIFLPRTFSVPAGSIWWRPHPARSSVTKWLLSHPPFGPVTQICQI